MKILHYKKKNTLTFARGFPTKPCTSYLDLHGMRHLYLFSSALSKFDLISKFNQDTTINTIPNRST